MLYERLVFFSLVIYSVSQTKSPLRFCGNFFKTVGREFFNQSLRAYCAFLSTLDYEFLLSDEVMPY